MGMGISGSGSSAAMGAWQSQPKPLATNATSAFQDVFAATTGSLVASATAASPGASVAHGSSPSTVAQVAGRTMTGRHHAAASTEATAGTSSLGSMLSSLVSTASLAATLL
jgi:hypothetical protein